MIKKSVVGKSDFLFRLFGRSHQPTDCIEDRLDLGVVAFGLTLERYPYKFGYSYVERKNLPVGDYGLIKDGKIAAIAERKTMDNFRHEISTYDVFKAALRELALFPHEAVVFESPCSDFLDPKKVKPYSANYIAEIVADLTMLFPDIQFVFCSNRKFAQEWIYRWFLRINNDEKTLTAIR